MTRKTILLREYQTLGSEKWDSGDKQVSHLEWKAIRDYVLHDSESENRKVMDVGDKTIRAINYVGVLQTRQGTTIEILPKVELDRDPDETQEREIFLQMLRHWRNGPCRRFNSADVRALKNFPLLEAFIEMFLHDMHELTRRGLARAYNEVEENRHALKGKLLIAGNLRRNLFHKERFYVRYQIFSENRPINRLFKSTLLRLQRLSASENSLRRIYKSLLHFENIPASANIDADLARARIDRTMPLYNRLLPWARLFLKGMSPTTWQDRHHALALLFPMEKIFEGYVTHLAKMAGAETGWEVRAQESRYYLMGKNPQGKSEFQLKPDIVARCGEKECRVMDAKWKHLARDKIHNDISQSDLYQMYAYGKKYQAQEGVAPELYLLYPRNRKFDERLVYEYEEGLRLTVFPLNLAVEHNPLAELFNPNGATQERAA